VVDLGPHPEAARRFNTLAEEVLARVLETPAPSGHRSAAQFQPDVFVASTFTIDETTSFQHLGLADNYTGEVAEIPFRADGKHFKLEGDGCVDFERLVARIAAQKPFSDYVAPQTIRAAALDWITAKLRDQHSRDLIAHLVERLSPTIATFKAVVPVTFLHVQSELRFGRIALQPLRPDFFESLSAWRSGSSDESMRADFDRWLLEYRRELQGHTAAEIEVTAEPEFATRRALSIASHAIGLLRFFSPESLYAEARSFVAPMGFFSPPKHDVWLFNPGEPSPFRRTTGFLDPAPVPWVLSDAEVAVLRSVGFDEASEIALGERVTAFDSLLEECILLFSRATTTASPAEKLVFVLVSLETLLLRTATEPIQQTVGDRMAFVLTRDPNARRKIATLFRDCYDMRSRFVHHGRDPSDLEALTTLLRHAWSLLTRALKNRSKFSTKSTFLDFADSIKYS
jgi:hypothetical protein